MVQRSKKRLVRFGAFELDLDAGELRKQGVRLQLQPKPLQMLEMLLENPGDIVTREDLRRRLWEGDTFVDYESGLNTAANRLRLKLGDSAENPRFIETLARTGYRFIAPVERVDWEPPVNTQSLAAPALPEPRRAAPRPLWVLVAAAVFLLAGLYMVSRRPTEPRVRFRQLTFRRGQIIGARFAPGGHEIVYAAQWGHSPRRLFLTSGTSAESRELGFQDMSLASMSRTGELALLASGGTMNIGGGKLFRVPMNSSAPSYVDQGIMSAEWSRDGAKLVLVRAIQGQNQLEYPAGTVVYRTSGWISNVRVSPISDSIAFAEHPVRHDDAGHVRLIAGSANEALGGEWASVSGLAWHPAGKEIWFTATRNQGPRGVWAISLSGKLRSIAAAPGILTLRDIAGDGRVLISREERRLEIAGKIGDAAEADFSWLDWSRVQEISPDGRVILFDESGEAAAGHSLAYLRRTADNTVVRLGEGFAAALSPDGKWALLISEDHSHLRLVPVEGGQAKLLPDTGLFYQWAKYFPDGARLLVLGHRPKEGLRLYVQSLQDAKLTPISPEMMVRNAAISPDGAQVAILSADNRLLIYPVTGGDAREVHVREPLAPLRWSADGLWILAQRLRSYTDLPAHIFRVRAATGQTALWKEITPRDPMGVNSVTGVCISSDERSYIYSYRRVLSELYVVEGW